MRLLALSAVAVLSMILLGTNSPAVHAAPTKETTKTIAIQPGDSLSTIAVANDSTAQRLFDANTSVENPDLIYPGEKLRIPRKDEVLATRPMPVATPPAPVPSTEPITASPQRTARTSSAPTAVGNSVWDQLAQCEAGGNWAINTGNGYYGGLQFSLSSWQAVGGSGLPSNASRDEQIMRGQMLQSRQGWGAWPSCSAKLGLS